MATISCSPSPILLWLIPNRLGFKTWKEGEEAVKDPVAWRLTSVRKVADSNHGRTSTRGLKTIEENVLPL